MRASSRLFALCLAPLLYACVAAIQATGGKAQAIAALALLPLALLGVFRLTEPRTIGQDLVGDEPRLGLRLAFAAAAIHIAARTAPAGRAGFDAAVAFATGLGASGALYALARVPLQRTLLEIDPVARRLDAVLAMIAITAVATTVPAVVVLFPARGGAIDPLTIDYTLAAQGAASLVLVCLAALRLRVLRRLELGTAERASAAFALSATTIAIGAPACFAPDVAPDRALPLASSIASLVVCLPLVAEDVKLVSRSLRTLFVVCIFGVPVALFTAFVAAAAPRSAAPAVLAGSLALVLLGVLSHRIASLFRPDEARWLRAAERARERAALPEPHAALQETLTALRAELGPSAPSPDLYRIESGDVVSVDRAGYLHETPAAPPRDLASLCDEEPERTLRLDVARAIEVRRPEVRPVVAWMEAHGYFAATTLRDDEGPIGVIAMPRAGRRSPLSLEEVEAIGLLTERLAAVFSLSSSLAGARRRQLDAEAAQREAEEELMRMRQHLARQGERYTAGARRFVLRTPLGRYSPAARIAEQELEKAAASQGPLVLLAPPGVPAEAFAAAAHLQGPRRDFPFLVVDGADAREHPMAVWLDPITSPFAVANRGTLAVLDVPALPIDVQRLLARFIAEPGQKLAGNDEPIEIFFVASVRETVDVLVGRGRLCEELADALGARTLPLPTLAARPEDIRPIALEHLSRLGTALRGGPVGISDDAVAQLVEHMWPLNDEELYTTLHRAVLATHKPVVTAETLASIGFSPHNPRPAARGPLSLESLVPSSRKGRRKRG